MPKLTLEDISLSLAINGLSRSSEAEDHLIAEDLKARRRDQSSRTADYFLSLKGKDLCRSCMFNIAMNALLKMTLPNNPSETDIAEQELIIRHYVIQEAMDRHLHDTNTVGQLH